MCSNILLKKKLNPITLILIPKGENPRKRDELINLVYNQILNQLDQAQPKNISDFFLV